MITLIYNSSYTQMTEELVPVLVPWHCMYGVLMYWNFSNIATVLFFLFKLLPTLYKKHLNSLIFFFIEIVELFRENKTFIDFEI